MTYPAFRCTECSLMRCTTPQTVCDECMARICEISYNTPQPIVRDYEKPFALIIPPGATLNKGASGYICYGSGLLTAVQSAGPCEIRIADAGSGLIPSMARTLYRWPCSPPLKLPLTFTYGMYVDVVSGNFTLSFIDSSGNLFTVPY